MFKLELPLQLPERELERPKDPDGQVLPSQSLAPRRKVVASGSLTQPVTATLPPSAMLYEEDR
jgi:hypothetical protein